MRLISRLAVTVLAATVSGCSHIPFMDNIPLWVQDRHKIEQLGKGAAVADVDKAFGRSRILWSKTVEVTGQLYVFRLYDSVESLAMTTNLTMCRSTSGCTTSYGQHSEMQPYAVIFVGAEPRLHAWGTLAHLHQSPDPAVVAMLPELTAHYTEYRLRDR